MKLFYVLLKVLSVINMSLLIEPFSLRGVLFIEYSEAIPFPWGVLGGNVGEIIWKCVCKQVDFT